MIWAPPVSETLILVGGLEHFSLFHILGINHPNWLIFFRGVETTNQHILFEIVRVPRNSTALGRWWNAFALTWRCASHFFLQDIVSHSHVWDSIIYSCDIRISRLEHGFWMVLIYIFFFEPVTNCDDHKYLSGEPIPNMGQSQRCVISRTVRITLQTLHSSMCVFTLSYNCMKRWSRIILIQTFYSKANPSIIGKQTMFIAMLWPIYSHVIAILANSRANISPF